jgi:peptidoglycan/LPS O-acetylase OafA/YrhL
LTHKQVCIMVAAPMRAAGYGAEHVATIAAGLLLSLLAGWLLYALVETPFMRLRARRVPAQVPSPGDAQVGQATEGVSDCLRTR